MAELRAVDVPEFAAAVVRGDRAAIARAITLVESTLPRHRPLADALLVSLLPRSGQAHRVGITGVPGAGKSTFIDALGARLVNAGHRVAVLAVDPTSQVTGGSILGDKTRMPRLCATERAFIRPSPSSGSLGGVTRRTRESMLVLEAAGFDVVLVETVGVGQSETAVAEMVDFFLVLLVAGAGDELQGIKRGIIEQADLVAITKADGANEAAAERARAEYAHALALVQPSDAGWRARAVTCSALLDAGIDTIWSIAEEHRARLLANGTWDARRRAQLVRWMWSEAELRLLDGLHQDPAVQALRAELEDEVTRGVITPGIGAERLLAARSRQAPPE